MTDNTQVNTGSGDIVRDIDRGAAKTQVVQLDAGGQSAEALVSAANPMPIRVGTLDTNTGGLPVDDSNLSNAQSSDAPFFVTVTGDPSGDFAGVNLLEEVIKDGTGLNVKVNVVNLPGKFDANGAEILSDGPAPIYMNGQSGTKYIFDTSGYQSLQVTSPSLGAVYQVSFGSDGVTFSLNQGMQVTNAAIVPASSYSQNTSAVYAVMGRFCQVSLLTPGSLIAYLRNTPVPITSFAAPQNLAFIDGTPPTAPGAAGGLAVGGKVAAGAAASGGLNPLIVAGVDSSASPLVRRLLTDTSGRLVVSATSAIKLAEESPVSNAQNVAALAVHDLGQFEGQDKYELLAQILQELKIVSHLLYVLPQLLNANPIAAVTADEPAVLRADPTIFN